MTREVAIDIIKKYDINGCGYCHQGGDEVEKAFNMAIKTLEQEPILDKIRAEIDLARFIDKDTKLCKNANASGLEVAMQIIDKYKAESEGKNENT